MNSRLTVLTAVGVACIASAAAWAREPLSIPGTGDCEPVVRELAAAFSRAHPGTEIIVPPSIGSSGGIRSVMKNEAVLARIARTLSDDETKAGLTRLPFARDGVVFVVGERVSVSGLNGDQIADVYSGKLRNWSELGGAPAPIRLVIREETDSVLRVLRTKFPPFDKLAFSADAKLANRSAELIEMVDRYKSAIGWSSQSMLRTARTSLKPLALDGVAPAPQSVASGSYPLSIEYAFVYRKGGLTDAAHRFLAFVASEPGRAVLERNGVAAIAPR